MISLREICNRFCAVWEIALGDESKLRALDISPAGFKRSFQAIIIALIPLCLRWFCLVQTMTSLPQDFSRSGIFIRAAFLDFCQWVVPLMLVIAASGMLGIRDRLIPFVIAYNWGKAFIEWLYFPFIALQLIMPDAHVPHWLFRNVMLLASIVIFYRLFQTALNKKISYALPFTILYAVVSVFVFIISLELVGWSTMAGRRAL